MSRNTSGNYTLPTGNPVTSGTTISSVWANSTLGDLQSEMTDSLCRSGKGAMLAPLKIVDGTSAAPALTWDADPDSGLYRAGAGDVRMQVDAAQAMKWTATAVTVPVALTVSGATTLSGTNTLSGATTLSGTTTVSGAATFTAAPTSNVGGAGFLMKPGSMDHVYMEFYADTGSPSTRSGYLGYDSAGTSQLTLANQMTNGDVRINANGSGSVAVGTEQIKLQGSAPASFTAISNALTKSSVVKGWALLKIAAAGGVSIVDGFNISSVTYGTTTATLTFASAFASTNYSALVTSGTGAPLAYYANVTGTTTLEVKARNLASGALPLSEIDFSAASGGDRTFSVVVFGAQ